MSRFEDHLYYNLLPPPTSVTMRHPNGVKQQHHPLLKPAASTVVSAPENAINSNSSKTKMTSDAHRSVTVTSTATAAATTTTTATRRTHPAIASQCRTVDVVNRQSNTGNWWKVCWLYPPHHQNQSIASRQRMNNNKKFGKKSSEHLQPQRSMDASMFFSLPHSHLQQQQQQPQPSPAISSVSTRSQSAHPSSVASPASVIEPLPSAGAASATVAHRNANSLLSVCTIAPTPSPTMSASSASGMHSMVNTAGHHLPVMNVNHVNCAQVNTVATGHNGVGASGGNGRGNFVIGAHQLRPLVAQHQSTQSSQLPPGQCPPASSQSSRAHPHQPQLLPHPSTTTTTTMGASMRPICPSKSMSSLDQTVHNHNQSIHNLQQQQHQQQQPSQPHQPFVQFPALFRVSNSSGALNSVNNSSAAASASPSNAASSTSNLLSTAAPPPQPPPSSQCITTNVVRRLPKEMARFCTQQLNNNAQHLRSLLTIRTKPNDQQSRQSAIVDLLVQYKGTNWRQEQLEYQMPAHDAEQLRRPTTESRFIRTRQRKSQVKTELFIAADHSLSCHKCNATIPHSVASVKLTLNDRPRTKSPSTAHENIREHFYHVDCFTCVECTDILVDLRAHVHHFESPPSPQANSSSVSSSSTETSSGSVACDYRLFCGRHYVELFKPRCPHCDELIFDDECTEAEGKAWHIGHFCCTECHRSLGGKQYIMAAPERSPSSAMPTKARPCQQMPFCLTCFDILFGELCEECGELIGCEVGAIIHEGRSWHATESCFRCSLCVNSLLGRPFLPALDGRIYCSAVCSQAMVAHQKDRTRRKNKLHTLNSHQQKLKQTPAGDCVSPQTQQLQQQQQLELAPTKHQQPHQQEQQQKLQDRNQNGEEHSPRVESMTLDRYQLKAQRRTRLTEESQRTQKPLNESEDVKSLDLSYEQIIKQSNRFFHTKYDWSKEQEFVDLIELPTTDDEQQIVFLEQKSPSSTLDIKLQQQHPTSKNIVEKTDSTDSGSVMERRESPTGSSQASHNPADSDGSFGAELGGLNLNSDSSECNSLTAVDFRNFRQFRKTQESPPNKCSQTNRVGTPLESAESNCNRTNSQVSPSSVAPSHCRTSSQTFDIKLNLDSNNLQQSKCVIDDSRVGVGAVNGVGNGGNGTNFNFMIEKSISLNSPASSNTSTAQWTISPPPEYSKLHDVDDLSSVASSQAQETVKRHAPKTGILKVKRTHQAMGGGIDSDASSSSWVQVRPELHYQSVGRLNAKQLEPVMKPRIVRTKSVSFDPKIDEAPIDNIQIDCVGKGAGASAAVAVRRVGSTKKSKSTRRQRHHHHHQQQQAPSKPHDVGVDDDCSDCSESSCSTCSSSSDDDDDDSDVDDELWDLSKLERNLDSAIGTRRFDARHNSSQHQHSRRRAVVQSAEQLDNNNRNNHDACVIS